MLKSPTFHKLERGNGVMEAQVVARCMLRDILYAMVNTVSYEEYVLARNWL